MWPEKYREEDVLLFTTQIILVIDTLHILIALAYVCIVGSKLSLFVLIVRIINEVNSSEILFVINWFQLQHVFFFNVYIRLTIR